MVVALLRGLEADTGKLQEIVLNDAATDLRSPVKAHLDELPKTRAVIIADCLGIAWGGGGIGQSDKQMSWQYIHAVYADGHHQ